MFKELLHCPGFMALHKTFYHFCSTLQSSVAKFWLSYLEMVQVLLMYLRSMRMADWKLRLHCLRKILPWVFPNNHVHYIRSLSLFWSEMTALPDTHPFAHQQLDNGEFCLQRGSSPFSQVPIDQGNEQTINRESKTMGGIVGFSAGYSPATVYKWVVNAHAELTLPDVLGIWLV